MPPAVLTYTYIHDTHIIISLWSSWDIFSLLRTRSRIAIYSRIIHIYERKSRSEVCVFVNEIQNKY